MERFPVLGEAFADPSTSEMLRPAWSLPYRVLNAALATTICSAFVVFRVAAVPSAQRCLIVLF